MTDWLIFRGSGVAPRATDPSQAWPAAPPWRTFDGPPHQRPLPPASARGSTFRIGSTECEAVNAAIHLRRPLLVTGKPGTGKSSLAYAIAHELGLGPVLVWSITSKTTLMDGLYQYDAIGRLHQVALEERRGQQQSAQADADAGLPQASDVGDYLTLGPLGTALLPAVRPRVLLIDEVDKSDVDFPNELLHVFEEGAFVIPELVRIAKKQPRVQVRAADGEDLVPVAGGRVRCREFPIVLMTSNGERDFPPAFKRRCLRIHMPQPPEEKLRDIIRAHLGEAELLAAESLIKEFIDRRDGKGSELSTDQLLNAIRLAGSGGNGLSPEVLDLLFKPLSGPSSI